MEQGIRTGGQEDEDSGPAGGLGLKDQFEVWRYNFPGRGEHPCVIISHPDIAARSEFVNILYCTSQRQSRTPKPIEVLLDTADGLDWGTFVNCSAMWLVESKDLFGKRGMVTLERRNAIRDKLRDIYRLAARD
jgi:mRNA-degrading endonuclease toxin of MazEF toxin-antitoxin module